MIANFKSRILASNINVTYRLQSTIWQLHDHTNRNKQERNVNLFADTTKKQQAYHELWFSVADHSAEDQHARYITRNSVIHSSTRKCTYMSDQLVLVTKLKIQDVNCNICHFSYKVLTKGGR